MTPAQALAFVERHGLVLEAARRGAIPSLADAVAGEPLHGSWWAHPRSRAIFAATRAVRSAPQVLVCRLIDHKISFAHQRLWPALVRLAEHLPHDGLARVHETHTRSGAHRVEHTPLAQWLTPELAAAAAALSEADARARLGDLLHELAIAS